MTTEITVAANSERKPSRARAYAFRLAAVTVGLLFALLCLEVLLRFMVEVPSLRNPLRGFHQSHERYGWLGKPNYAARFRQPEFDALIEISQDGFRRLPASDDAAPDAPRLVFLGDSFTWGWGVGQGETFCDQFQDLIGDQRRVVCRGLSGTGGPQQLVILREEILPANPKVVTLAFFANDCNDAIDPRDGTRPYASIDSGKLEIRNLPVANRIEGSFHWLRSRSVAIETIAYQFNILNEWLRVLRGKPAQNLRNREKAPNTTGWPVAAAIIEEMARECREHQPPVEFRLMYIPTLFDLKQDRDLGYAELKEGPRGPMGLLCEKLELPLLDLTIPLAERYQSGRDDFRFRVDGHWNALGNQLVAEQLDQFWDW